MSLKLIRYLILVFISFLLLLCCQLEDEENVKSADASLSILQVVGFDFEFNSSKKEYRVKVPYDVDNVEIIAVVSHQGATINANLENKPLEVGENRFEIDVTAENGNKETYVLIITREKYISNDNAFLSGIDTSIEGLSLNFNKEKYNYSFSVDNNIDSITITGTPEDSKANVTGNGTHSLSVGDNSVELVVTAEDGITIKKYTLSVKREAAYIPASNALLSDIDTSIEGLSLNFNKEKYNYSFFVDNNIDSITITGTPEDSKANVTGNGTYSLSVGDNSAELVVTAEDGITIKKYTLLITRESTYIPGSNALLSDIQTSIEGYNLNFSKDKYNYSLIVDNSVSSITVTGIAEDSKSTVTGNGSYSLTVGENKIELIVIAEDVITTRKYSLSVTREALVLPNNNAKLKELSISSYTLNPVFNSTIYAYNTTVSHNVSQITLVASPQEDNANVTGVGNVDLSYGINNVSIIVTAPDGITKQEYKLKIERENPPIVDDSSLLSLTISTGTLTPVFNSDVHLYRASVPYEVSSTVISPVANILTSTISGSGVKELSVGENIFDIIVTAADNISKTKYTIVITREKYIPSNNSKLSSLSLSSGTLSPVFSGEILSYTTQVPYDTSSVTVNASTQDSKANVKSGTGVTDLIIGENTIKVTVEAEDKTLKTYTITVKREECQVSNTFNFNTSGDEVITLTDNNNTFNSNDKFQVVIVEDFDSYMWLIDSENTFVTTKIINIDCSKLEPGNHQLTAVVVKNGKGYSKSLYFSVSNN